MATVPTIEEAVGLHQTGRLDEAKVLYNGILAYDPEDVNALHMSGVLALQQNNAPDAIKFIGRALAIVPDNPHFLSNFATALLETGAVDDAITQFRKTLSIDPSHLDARYNLGNALRIRGDTAEAANEYQRVTEQEPAHLPAFNNFALCVAELGRLIEAIQCLNGVLRRAPHDPQTHTNIGLLLLKLRQPEEAMLHFDAALEATPDDINLLNGRATALIDTNRLDEASILINTILQRVDDHSDALLNLANLQVKKEQFAEAEIVYRRLLEHDSENADVWSNLGKLFWGQFRHDEAETALMRALEIRPNDPYLLHAYTNSLVAAGRLDEAEVEFGKLISGAPDMPEVLFGRGLLSLARGRFGDGFRDYRLRLRIHDDTRQVSQDRLPAELSGKIICVEGDQGLGDEIFFLRFMPQLKSRGAQLHYTGDSRLISMLNRAAIVDQLHLSDKIDLYPAGSIAIAVGDLPYVLGMENSDTPPLPLPLIPEPTTLLAVRDQLAAFGPPPYFGLTWRSGTKGKIGTIFKEVPLASFAQALNGTVGTFVALQRLPEDGEIAWFADQLGAPLHDLTNLNDDLEAMLALTGLLDEYVCVSNTNVHLRTSQGKPCRVLVPHPPEFRWMYDSEESPWFPGTQIYRQSLDGNWQPALTRLAQDLRNAPTRV